MIKIILIAAGVYIFWLVLIFTAIAFFNYNINPAKWGSEARLFFSFFGIVVGLVISVGSALFTYETINDKKRKP